MGILFESMLLSVHKNLKIVLRLHWCPILLIFPENNPLNYGIISVVVEVVLSKLVEIVCSNYCLGHFSSKRICFMIISGYPINHRSVYNLSLSFFNVLDALHTFPVLSKSVLITPLFVDSGLKF